MGMKNCIIWPGGTGRTMIKAQLFYNPFFPQYFPYFKGRMLHIQIGVVKGIFVYCPIPVSLRNCPTPSKDIPEVCDQNLNKTIARFFFCGATI